MPDAQLIAAWAASGTALVAAAGVMDQYRRGRRTEGHDFLLRFLQAWEAPDNRVRRVRVAADLLKRPPEISRLTIDVLNYFETLGYFVRSGSVNSEGAWVNFSVFAVGYWLGSRSQIDEQRRYDPTLYADFEQLVNRFLKLEAKQRHLTGASSLPSPQEVIEFLENEVELEFVVNPPPLPPAASTGLPTYAVPLQPLGGGDSGDPASATAPAAPSEVEPAENGSESRPTAERVILDAEPTSEQHTSTVAEPTPEPLGVEPLRGNRPRSAPKRR